MVLCIFFFRRAETAIKHKCWGRERPALNGSSDNSFGLVFATRGRFVVVAVGTEEVVVQAVQHKKTHMDTRAPNREKPEKTEARRRHERPAARHEGMDVFLLVIAR